MEKLSFINDRQDKLANILCKRGFSYNYVCKLLRNKDVKVDDIRIKDNLMIEQGSQITVFYEASALSQGYEIVFEDDNVIVLDKKTGIEVEGVDGLEGKIAGSMAVHRLDRNTEGLMIMAKNRIAKDILLEAFKNHKITKKYLAEVVGSTAFNGETYKAYLGKDSENSQVRIFANAGKGREEIKTAFKTLKSNPTSSIVECDLLTGKTHQIRAHLAYLGHAIIGDGKYGKNIDNKKFKKKTQQLFCCYLKLNGLNNQLEYLNGKIFQKNPDWLKI